MPAARKRRPVKAGRRPGYALPPRHGSKTGTAAKEGGAGVNTHRQKNDMGALPEPSASGSGGERRRSEVTDFSPEAEMRDAKLVPTTPGRPRVYETPEELQEAVEAYFDSISRTVDAVELVDSGRRDSSGHVVYEPVKICNDDGEIIRKVEFILPPTVTDLCLYLGITRQTWVNYANREGYRQVTDWAKARVESYLRRESLTRTKGLQGVIFNLEQNFKHEEKKEHRPLEALDLSSMTDEELLAMVNGG